LLPAYHRERRRDAHVVQVALVVVEAEQERAEQRALALLVEAEACHHALGGALVLDLEHGALAGLVRLLGALGDHAVEAGALEAREPLHRERMVARERREVERRRRSGQRTLEARAALGLRKRAQVFTPQ